MIFKVRDRATIRYPTLFIRDYLIEDNIFVCSPINQTTDEPVNGKTFAFPASVWNVFPEYRAVKPDLVHSHGMVSYHIIHGGHPCWILPSSDPDYGIIIPALEGYSVNRAKAEYQAGSIKSIGVYPFSKELLEDRYQPGKAFIGSKVSNDAMHGTIISIFAKSLEHPSDDFEPVRELTQLTERDLIKESLEEYYALISTDSTQTLVVLSVSDLKIIG